MVNETKLLLTSTGPLHVPVYVFMCGHSCMGNYRTVFVIVTCHSVGCRDVAQPCWFWREFKQVGVLVRLSIWPLCYMQHCKQNPDQITLRSSTILLCFRQPAVPVQYSTVLYQNSKYRIRYSYSSQGSPCVEGVTLQQGILPCMALWHSRML